FLLRKRGQNVEEVLSSRNRPIFEADERRGPFHFRIHPELFRGLQDLLIGCRDQLLLERIQHPCQGGLRRGNTYFGPHVSPSLIKVRRMRLRAESYSVREMPQDTRICSGEDPSPRPWMIRRQSGSPANSLVIAANSWRALRDRSGVGAGSRSSIS